MQATDCLTFSKHLRIYHGGSKVLRYRVFLLMFWKPFLYWARTGVEGRDPSEPLGQAGADGCRVQSVKAGPAYSELCVQVSYRRSERDASCFQSSSGFLPGGLMGHGVMSNFWKQMTQR